jgi:hypothetical protein
VVVVSAGMEGDTQKDLVLTEASAMVVREYLVENFGFDDSQLEDNGNGQASGRQLRHRLGYGTNSHLLARERTPAEQGSAPRSFFKIRRRATGSSPDPG